MPVDFLTAEQKAGYGQFSGEPNEVQLTRYFHLDEADLAFISNQLGVQNQLGFALQITSVRFLGGFLSDACQYARTLLVFSGGKRHERSASTIKPAVGIDYYSLAYVFVPLGFKPL